MIVRKRLATLVAALVVLAFASNANAGENFRFGTLAPQQSHWGKVFSAWAEAVGKKSGGNLKISWDYNGAAGDEKAMIAKIKSGQLQGAAVTSVGLAAIHRPFLALQMPGLCSKWSCIDKVRNGVRGELETGAANEGFFILGDGDVGAAHTFSKGVVIRNPSDLGSAKVYAMADDPAADTLASVLGYTPVKKSVPTLLPALQQGTVNVATVPSLAAEQLQWSSHFTHVVSSVAGFGVGGLVVSQSKLNGLPGDVKSMLKDTGEKAGKMLTKRTRKRDYKSYKRLKKKLTVTKLSKSEKAAWESKFAAARKTLGQGTYPSAFVSKLERLAGK